MDHVSDSDLRALEAWLARPEVQESAPHLTDVLPRLVAELRLCRDSQKPLSDDELKVLEQGIPKLTAQARRLVTESLADRAELRTWRAFAEHGIEFIHVTYMPGKEPYWAAYKREPDGHTTQAKTWQAPTMLEAGKAALEGLGIKTP